MDEACSTVVLLLDDCPAYRRAMKRLLQSAGIRAIGCATTRSAQRLLDLRRVDVAVVDLGLPGGDGLGLLAWLRDHPELAGLPVIINSGAGDVSVLPHLRDLGVRRFLIKGTSRPAELIEAIRGVTGRAVGAGS